jgi:hypothetical protein
MATQKKMAEVPVPAELVALRDAIRAERSAVVGSADSVKAKNAALRGVWLAYADMFAADLSFTADMAIDEYYNGNNAQEKPKARALISRRTEYNSIASASRQALPTVKAIWPEAKEGEKNTTRPTFLKGCNVIKDNPTVAVAVVKKAMFEVAPIFKAPDLKLANAGDLVALIVAAGTALMNADPETFGEYSADLLKVQSRYIADRAKGELRTTKEIDDAPAPVAMMAPVQQAA